MGEGGCLQNSGKKIIKYMLTISRSGEGCLESVSLSSVCISLPVPKTRARHKRADCVGQMIEILNRTAVRPFTFGQILGMTRNWPVSKMHAALQQAGRARKPAAALWWMIKNKKLLGIA